MPRLTVELADGLAGRHGGAREGQQPQALIDNDSSDAAADQTRSHVGRGELERKIHIDAVIPRWAQNDAATGSARVELHRTGPRP